MLILISIVIFTSMNKNSKSNPNNKKNENNNLCNQLSELKNNNNSFVIIIEDKNNISKELKEDYPSLSILNVTSKDLEDDCLKNELKQEATYELIHDKAQNTITNAYQKGHSIGLINSNNYYDIEAFLNSKSIIQKKEITEKTTLEDFAKNINDKYILIIIGDEKIHRNVVTKKAKKHFNNYKYDIVNYNSKEGKKIYDYIIKNYKIGDTYPQAIKFENSRIIAKTEVFDIDENYKKLLNNN